MLLAVPYFKQDTEDNCGSAVLRMIAAFYDRKLSAEDLKIIARVEEEGFTKNSDMVQVAEELGFNVKAKDGATIDEIREYLEEDVPIIVNYIELGEELGHFAVVIGLEDENIVMNDPEHGAGFSLPITKFEQRWRSGFENYKRWLMVATPNSAQSSA